MFLPELIVDYTDICKGALKMVSEKTPQIYIHTHHLKSRSA